MKTFFLAMLAIVTTHQEAFALPSYTSLCSQIGQEVNVAITTEDDEIIEKNMVIGDPDDRCPGRCGSGCEGRQVYTQECLEHDLCEHTKGTSFGPCKSLMKRAAFGFTIGAVCR